MSVRIKIGRIIAGQKDYVEMTLFPLISARPKISTIPFDINIEMRASLY